MGFAAFGNRLYTGETSIDFVGRRRLWYLIGGSLMLVSLLGLGVRHLNASIEFRGGSEFRISQAKTTDEFTGEQAVARVAPENERARVSQVGTDSVRVQTDRLTSEQTDRVRTALAKAYGVPQTSVTASFIGPSWGADVSRKALRALVVFLVLVSVVMALYFRTWKMSLAAIVALLHDLVITVGVYAIVGFEVSPATVIGFLTILGYSIYDTVVVFDKVRENTAQVAAGVRWTFVEAANLAVNQTLVRSINTSVVALLPVASILFIGSFLLGAGTLKDISLALFVGIAAGTYSSIFIATPLLADLRAREPAIATHTAKVLARRAGGDAARSGVRNEGRPARGGQRSTRAGTGTTAVLTTASGTTASGTTASRPAGSEAAHGHDGAEGTTDRDGADTAVERPTGGAGRSQPRRAPRSHRNQRRR